jgi:hypothetical protein
MEVFQQAYELMKEERIILEDQEAGVFLCHQRLGWPS